MSYQPLMMLTEPVWWQHLLETLNMMMKQSPVLSTMIPFMADVFVFTYPLFLIAYYLIGIQLKNHHRKVEALTIFLAAVLGFVVNFIFKIFVGKARPDQVLFAQNDLILQALPKFSFPSDHATVSMTMAVATLFIALQIKNKGLRWFAIFLIWGSLVMCVSRVMIGVHWPTDILAGWLIGALIWWGITRMSVVVFLKKYIFDYLIHFQEFIFGLFTRKKY